MLCRGQQHSDTHSLLTTALHGSLRRRTVLARVGRSSHVASSKIANCCPLQEVGRYHTMAELPESALQVTPMLTSDIVDVQNDRAREAKNQTVPFYYRSDQHPWLFTWTGGAVFQV